MFHIGDKIFYPIHGAGVIEAIVEKEFLGEKQPYFVLDMLLRELQIMVPLHKMDDLNIRPIVEEHTLEAAFVALNEGEPDLSVTAAQRHRINMEKIKRGDIYEEAEVIRDLTWISRTKVLGHRRQAYARSGTAIIHQRSRTRQRDCNRRSIRPIDAGHSSVIYHWL